MVFKTMFFETRINDCTPVRRPFTFDFSQTTEEMNWTRFKGITTIRTVLKVVAINKFTCIVGLKRTLE